MPLIKIGNVFEDSDGNTLRIERVDYAEKEIQFSIRLIAKEGKIFRLRMKGAPKGDVSFHIISFKGFRELNLGDINRCKN